jgi:hypothetical protein
MDSFNIKLNIKNRDEDMVDKAVSEVVLSSDSY